MKTSDKIKIMQAYDAGAQIEYQIKGDEWIGIEYPNFNWGLLEYRVKEVEMWVNVSPTGDNGGRVYPSAEKAAEYSLNSEQRRVKFYEDI